MTDKINLDLIDQLLKDYKSPEEVLGKTACSNNSPKPFLNAPCKPNSLITSAMINML